MQLPSSLGLIPDGNRRWAKKHGLSFAKAYSIGVQRFIDFANWCKDYGINNLTVWAFSTENFNRPFAEKRVLFSIYHKVLTDKGIRDMLHKNETRFIGVGNIAMLPATLQKALRKIEDDTRAYTKRTINMLIAYGGRDDIFQAAKRFAKTLLVRGQRQADASPESFRSMLLSASVPDLDLVIRTSGEERLSGFMPWQTAYAELYFSKKLWPDFTKKDLDLALSDYARRQRRFGR